MAKKQEYGFFGINTEKIPELEKTQGIYSDIGEMTNIKDKAGMFAHRITIKDGKAEGNALYKANLVTLKGKTRALENSVEEAENIIANDYSEIRGNAGEHSNTVMLFGHAKASGPSLYGAKRIIAYDNSEITEYAATSAEEAIIFSKEANITDNALKHCEKAIGCIPLKLKLRLFYERLFEM